MTTSLPRSLKAKVSRVLPDIAKRKYRQFFPAEVSEASTKPAKPIEYWIDVVSGCNLRCTACPVGMPEFSNSIGQQLREMEPEIFEQICIKAKQDTKGNMRIGLYNWTEPTLHSRLDELLAIGAKHGIPCGLSSNLNHDYDWQKLKPYELWNFTITVSGFTQKTYAINHRGGRIEPVLANLLRISQQLSDWPSYKNIDVRYLVHRENQHEVALFKHFCDALEILRLAEAKRQVLKFPFQLPDAETVRERRIDVHRLQCDATALRGIGDEMQRAHVVKPIGQLHQKDPDVFRHRE